MPGDVNYIRNSVKVLIDAYDGTVQFLAIDETDPILATYRQIFPHLFQARSTIPADLKAHFRYPEDLFKIQAQIYLAYHMSDPEVFYNREDLWHFPVQTYEGNQVVMEPYYVIDISVRAIEDLYDNFDRTATYPKRDLDLDFANHLVNCVREIGKYPFILRISFSQPEVTEKMERVRTSIKNFFDYLNELERQRLRALFRQSCILLGFGIGLLFLSISINTKLAKTGSILAKILTEGVTVIAWVSLWEAIANFILVWQPHYQTMKLHHRIVNAQVTFRHHSNP